jgi:hypothetical protein
MKNWLAGIFVLLGIIPRWVAQENSAPFKTEYVVVLVIDGPRFTETFGDSTCANIPYLCDSLAPLGVLYSNFRTNTPRTTTNAGHTAMTTGVNQRISNDGKQLPKHPSMFQYYMKEKGVDKNKLWIVSSKGKLSILGNTKDKKWRDLYVPYVYCGKNGNGAEYVGDASTFQQVTKVISFFQPSLMLVNLLAPDVWAHGNNWNRYIQSLKESDQYAWELWTMIQKNPQMKDKTTLFITNDHGRNEDGYKDGFVSHGANTPSNRHIFLLAIGPDFKTNTRIETEGELTDIPTTIARLLGFSMPTAQGRVLVELFN